MKSGVELDGKYSAEFSFYTEFVLYDGANNGNTAEDAILIFDDVTGATASAVLCLSAVFFCSV